MKLAQLIEKRRVKQVQLAEKLGVKQPTVSRWISEQVRPAAKSVPLLAKALDATVDWKQYIKGRLRFKAK